MPRLPIPGQDPDVWGNILNDFLTQEHQSDGTLKMRSDGTLSGFYTKPGSGIPSTDLAAGAQAALGAVAGKLDVSTAVAKGDLLVASAASTIARLGVGGNGQKLVADSNQTLGVKWASDAFLYASDYGAVFDGVTNDAAALQSAINAAITAGKPLILPSGTAIIGTALSIGSPVTIIGSGRDATILRAANGLDDYVLSFTGGSAGVGIVAAHLSDFSIDGNHASQTAGGGISANGAVQCSFVRLHLTGCYNWGLILGPITGGAFGHHNRVIECLFDNAGSSAGFGGWCLAYFQ